MGKLKNTFKKSDANGNELAEEIGKGINKEHLEKVMEERKFNDIITFKLPAKLKEDFVANCKNPSEVLRAFARGYVSQSKKLK